MRKKLVLYRPTTDPNDVKHATNEINLKSSKAKIKMYKFPSLGGGAWHDEKSL